MRSRQNRIRQSPDPTPVDRAIEKSNMSNLKTKKYARKLFVVDAVEVTPENFQAVADWCNGEIITEKRGRALVQHIKVNVTRPLNERQGKAYVGDHVLYAGSGYKIYPAKAFHNNFEELEQRLQEDDQQGTLFDAGFRTLNN